MGAVALVGRTLLRRRVAARIALVVLIGIAGGAVLAAAAGARRTEAAFPALVDRTETSDVVVLTDRPLDLESVRAVDGVVAVRTALGLGLAAPGPDGLPDFDDNPGAQASPDGALIETDRFLLLEGRQPDPDEPTEVLINERAAENDDLRPGDSVDFSLFRFDELETLFASLPADQEPTDEDIAALQAILTPVELTVVGIGRPMAEIVANENQTGPRIALTPAFANTHEDDAGYHVTYIDTASGDVPTDLRAVLDDANATEIQSRPALVSTVRGAVAPYHDSLIVFAVVGGLTALLIIGQTVIRQAISDSRDDEVLSALGMTRGQLVRATATCATVVAAGGAALAVALAVIASPMFPIGPAGRAEPEAGIAVDLPVLVGGATLIVILLVTCSLVAAWGQTHTEGGRHASAQRPMAILTALEASRPRSPSIIGVRLALQPAGGGTGSARATTIGGLAVAMSAILAALTFGVSLDHLVSSPPAYGWTWDATYETYENGLEPAVARSIADDPSVSSGTTGARSPVTLAGQSVAGYGFHATNGSPLPAVTAGRFPGAPDEVALGAATMRRLGRSVGDTVEATAAGNTIELTVVGRVVTPSLNLDDTYGLADSAVFDLAGLQALNPDARPSFMLLDFVGTATDAGQIEEANGRHQDLGGRFLGLQRPGDITAYANVRHTPLLLAGLLAALGFGALAHGLLTSIRLNRRPLAVLATIGFTRRQLRAVVAWQASSFVLIASMFAVPLGVAGGRWAWSVLADQLGIPSAPVVPVLTSAAVVVATLLLANLVGSASAALARRTRPATVLRTE